MIEVNLIPDVKREFLRSQRMRNMVISASIFIMIASAGVLVVLGLMLGAVQGVGLIADQDIKSEYKKLSEQSDLDNLVTIQRQLSQVSALDESRGMNSRVFEVLSAINPPAPNNITMSTVRFDPVEATISVDGWAANSFTATDILKKTILNTKLQYNDGASTQEVPLATEVSLTNASYLEQSTGEVALHFTLSFNYPAALTSNKYKNVAIVTPSGRIDVTDSKTHVPNDLFATSSSSDKEDK